nr:MAG TPA: DNA-directed RNA polymerase specialized sigma subunit [Caudoviricetes sp.]
MMLSDEEEQMMRMYYMKHKTFNEIADELGYSEVGIAKMHQRIVKKIRKYI